MEMTLNQYIEHLKELAETHGECTVKLIENCNHSPLSMNNINVEKAQIVNEFSVGGCEGYLVEENLTLEDKIGRKQMQFANEKPIAKYVVLNFPNFY